KHSRPLAEYIANTDAVLDAIDLHDVYAVFLSEENVTWNNGLAILNGLYEHIKKRYPGVPVYQWLTAPAGPHAKLRADGWVYDFYGRRRDEFRRKVMEYLATGKPLVMCLNASPDVARFESPGGRTVSEEQLDVCREFNVPVFFYCVDLKWGSPGVWLHSDAPEIVPWRRWTLGAVDRMHATASGTLPLPSSQCSAGRTIEIAGDDANRYKYDEPFATSRFIYDATIRGFWNVQWGGLGEKLIITRRAGQMPAVELVYHFVSEFPIRDIRARLSGQTMGTAPVTLALSVTGNKWPWQQTARGAETTARRDFQLTVSAGEASPVREFWVR
ncbi:MAG: hypothetical protein GXP27_14770, partial [Planctomycetes bacterium]|nr:hypothetical protein [Planctomycetota bacterium]